MSFGPGPWETQLLGGTANPVRKWGEGGGRRMKTSPWRCRGAWEGDRDTAFIIIGWMPWWHANVKYPPSLPHSSSPLIALPCEDKSWPPFLSYWCTWIHVVTGCCKIYYLPTKLFSPWQRLAAWNRIWKSLSWNTHNADIQNALAAACFIGTRDRRSYKTRTKVKIHWCALSVVEYKCVHAEELWLLHSTKSRELSLTQNISNCSFMFLRHLV